jgi:hypothetical protein
MSAQTLLFLAAFNILTLEIKIIAVITFVIFVIFSFKKIWKFDFSKVYQPIKINIFFVLIAVIILIFVHIQGPLSFNEEIFNFDWHKYNVLLNDISEHPGLPALHINDKETNFHDERHALTYYYAIFMPAACVGYLVNTHVTPDLKMNIMAFIFDAWLLLGQILALLIIPAVINSIFGNKKSISFFSVAYILFVLFMQMDGWEYLIREGALFLSDIEWNNRFYFPLRLQSFLSYSYWIPGHLTASMLGLFVLSIFKKVNNLKFIPIFVIYLYTLSSSLFAFCSIQLFIYILWLNNSKEDIKYYLYEKKIEILIVILTSIIIILFYSVDIWTQNYLAILSKIFKLFFLFIATYVFISLNIIKKNTDSLKKYFLRYKRYIFFIMFIGFVIYLIIQKPFIFNSIPIYKYLLFFIKELSHLILIIIIASKIIYKHIKIPKLIIACFIFIVCLSFMSFKAEDYFFSGIIGALMLINLYICYLFEKLKESHKIVYLSLMIFYCIAVAPSAYSLYYETYKSKSRMHIPLENRINLIKNKYPGLLRLYTSPIIYNTSKKFLL